MMMPRNTSSVLAFSSAFFVLLLYAFSAKYLQFNSFMINDYDSGIYSNLAWNIAMGKGYYSDVSQVRHLGEHFSPIMLLIAPFYRLYSSVLTLYAALAVAYAATFLILYTLLRDIFQKFGQKKAALFSLLLLMALFFSRPLNSALYFEFHPSTLALPFIALAFLGISRSRPGLLCLAVSLLLLTKENSSLALVGLGLYAWLVTGRRRWGILLFLIAGAHAILVFKVVMPLFRDGEWGHYSRLGPWANIPEKLEYLWLLTASFGLLPVFAPRALACALPLVLLNLVVAAKNQFSVNFHYDDMTCVFLTVAAALGFRSLLEWAEQQKKGVRVGVFSLAAALCIYTNARDNRIEELAEAFVVASQADRVQLRRELQPYISDTSLGIVASTDLGPYLSLRPWFRSIIGPQSLENVPPGVLVMASPVAGSYLLRPGFYEALRAHPEYTTVHDSPVLTVFRHTPRLSPQSD